MRRLLVALAAAGALTVLAPPAHATTPTSARTARWHRTADCESGRWTRRGDPASAAPGSANWHDVGAHYEGGLHFLNSTWLSNHGDDFAMHAYDATPAEQIIVAERTLAGARSDPWPTCGPAFGITVTTRRHR